MNKNKIENGWYWITLKGIRKVNAGWLQREVALYEDGLWSVCGYECCLYDDDILMNHGIIPDAESIVLEKAKIFFGQFDSFNHLLNVPDGYLITMYGKIKYDFERGLFKNGYNYLMPHYVGDETINKLLVDTRINAYGNYLMIEIFGKGSFTMSFEKIDYFLKQ